MTSCVFAVVCVIQHGNSPNVPRGTLGEADKRDCSTWNFLHGISLDCIYECSTWNIGRGVSPGCIVHLEKSQEDATSRGGVPVFRRERRKPSPARLEESSFEDGLPSPALSEEVFPTHMRPLREVPDVITMALAEIKPWVLVVTPTAFCDGEAAG